MAYIARLDVSESKPITNCKHCVFAIKSAKGNNQIGCLPDRISAFKDSGTSVVRTTDDDESYYTIGGLCNLFRDEKWKHYEEAKDAGLFDRDDIYLHKAKEEICTSFGIIIYDNENDCGKLKHTIDSIRSAYLLAGATDYPKNKIKIVVSSIGQKNDFPEYIQLVESCVSEGWEIELVLNSKESPKHVRDFDAFNKCAHLNYLAHCDSGASLASSTLARINSSLNYKMEKVITFSQNSLFGPVNFIMKSIASSEYLKYNDFQKMFENIKSQCIDKSMHKEL